VQQNGEVDRAAERGREAFGRRAWRDAYTFLSASERADAEDLERLAVAAYLLGRDAEAERAWAGAYAERVRAGEHEDAGHCAFWLAFTHLLRGETARAGAWVAQAERALVGVEGPCAARGLLIVLRVLEAVERGDAGEAADRADEMGALARRCDDPDLQAFADLCRGEVAIAQGRVANGLRSLDEAMLSVAKGEPSPVCTGIVYCAAIAACIEAFDLGRAAEWTAALGEWCDSQPDLVPFRGQCLVHRSQVLQARGAWAEAAREAERARVALSEPAHGALGVACYQQGELHRLRGEFAEAERAYRAARERGFEPAPGLALLRLATGDRTAAVAAVDRMVGEARGSGRAAALAAAVEIHLAVERPDRARVYADDLTRLAAEVAAPLLDAAASYANGCVTLAEGDAAAALVALRHACARWHDLGVPYEAARSSVQIALACRSLGDEDTANLELDVARAVFERLGARPDLTRVALLVTPGSASRGPLTDRECEVLRLVAAGMTNRDIGRALAISEHTVARHVQNIFTKLGVSSRAAATAYAYEHGVV
jgi:ATP/maltotriose-dependent transcriptional regulator MalT